jgi:hypothetical protein
MALVTVPPKATHLHRGIIYRSGQVYDNGEPEVPIFSEKFSVSVIAEKTKKKNKEISSINDLQGVEHASAVLLGE